MPDRVKETVFNILGAHYGCPGELPALHVADLFAGSGSIGLEALSRGVSSCCFFERDRTALEALRQNLASLGLVKDIHVRTGDAWSQAPMELHDASVALVFVDPPYQDSLDASREGPVRCFLERIVKVSPPGALVVLHHANSVEYELEAEEGWRIKDHRIIGTNAVTIFEL